MWSKKHVKLFITVFFIGAAGIIFFVNNNNKDVIIDEARYHSFEANTEERESNSVTNEDDNVNKDNAESKESLDLVVHICGEVNNPGVYELRKGLRVADLVELAGGFTDNAAQDYINQAGHLQDGQQIYIPSILDVEDKNLADSLIIEDKSNINTDSNTTDKKQNKININTASEDELMTLPGIGKAKAENIIRYREDNGYYSKIEDIMNVTGIKEGLFNNISEYITI